MWALLIQQGQVTISPQVQGDPVASNKWFSEANKFGSRDIWDCKTANA